MTIAPSEYVSTGVLSAPYHGAGCDGVAYYDYENGNTVASNVVTEAQGTPIPASTLKGVVAENAATNLALYSSDFSQTGTWVKNGTGTQTATTLSDTDSGEVTVYVQSFTVDANTDIRNYSISILKTTGATVFPMVAIRHSGFEKQGILNTNTGMFSARASFVPTYIGVVSEGDYWRVHVGHANPNQTLLTIKVYPAASSDGTTVGAVTLTNEITVRNAQLEEGVHPTTYIPTGASAVTRNADVLSYASSGNIDSTVGAMSAEFTNEFGGTYPVQNVILEGNGSYLLYIHTSNAHRGYDIWDGTNTHIGFTNFTGSNTLRKGAVNWGDSLMNSFFQGTANTASTFDNDFNFGATITIGNISAGNRAWNGTLKNIKIWKRKLPANLLVGETS